MPWVKGKSGNPNGPPPKRNALARLIRTQTMNGQELVEWSLRVLRDESLPIAARQAEKEWLSDRGWGKAVETIVLEDDRESAGLPAPTPEALEAIAGAPDGNLQ